MLDTGFQASFISESCVTALGLKRTNSKISITGLSATDVGHGRGTVSLRVMSMVQDVTISVDALILPKVTGTLPSIPFKKEDWIHLTSFTLADPYYNQPGRSDVLLGADIVASIMSEGKRCGPCESPIAQNSELGWIVSNRVSSSGPFIKVHLVNCERFWEI